MSDLFYIQPDVVVMGSKVGAIVNDNSVEQTVFYCLPCSLQDAYLDVLFSIPDGVAEPTVKDIDGVYIVDWAGVTLGGRADISGSTQEQMLALIDELVGQIATDDRYNVVVERKQNAVATQKKINIDGDHLLQAISYALVEAIEDCDLSYAGVYYDSIDSIVRDCMAGHKPIEFTLKDVSYKLISAEKIVVVGA